MTYSEKLQDPRWQKKRLEVLNRCDWMCRGCDRTNQTLYVHHRYYLAKRLPWEYPIIAYVALCQECHDSIQKADALHTEWETLLADIFDENEVAWDGISISFEVAKHREAGASKDQIRDAIEIFLSDDEVFAEFLSRGKARRERWSRPGVTSEATF